MKKKKHTWCRDCGRLRLERKVEDARPVCLNSEDCHGVFIPSRTHSALGNRKSRRGTIANLPRPVKMHLRTLRRIQLFAPAVKLPPAVCQ